MPEVVVILGSPSDRPWAERILEALERFGVKSEVRIASAHKTPTYLLEMLGAIEARGGERVYITVAGRSNALSGFVDAAVTSPVIACPPASESFGGMDILSSLRMPSGVAPLVVLDPANAALAAVKMLALANAELREAVSRAQQADRERVIDADRSINREAGADRLGDTGGKPLGASPTNSSDISVGAGSNAGPAGPPGAESLNQSAIRRGHGGTP